ncbi:hypothetical protein J2TS4_24650 [Paenibacillus sp. J2TS4]|nr:hypothetical protein J2TS4_24650 [Paenibacillus sp. J2TS4]
MGSEGAVELIDDIPYFVNKEGRRELPITESAYESKSYSLYEFARSIRTHTASKTEPTISTPF